MKYRKKPVVIEAIQWTGDNKEEIEEFVGESAIFIEHESSCLKLQIQTLEGIMNADKDDYIIKGVKGEFYPCKPDVFEQTYEEHNNHDLSMS